MTNMSRASKILLQRGRGTVGVAGGGGVYSLAVTSLRQQLVAHEGFN